MTANEAARDAVLLAIETAQRAPLVTRAMAAAILDAMSPDLFVALAVEAGALEQIGYRWEDGSIVDHGGEHDRPAVYVAITTEADRG